MKVEIVHREKYRNRQIVIVRLERDSPNLGRMFFEGLDADIREYHNGYVSVVNRLQREEPAYQDYISKFNADELTFCGHLDNVEDLPEELEGVWFFGFDSAHGWNRRNPESRTKESVLQRARELADEMVEARV